MEIGVISDTHGLVRPEVYDVFDGVDLILHAGDIGGRDVIIELEAIAPVRAVAGNMDAGLAGRFAERDNWRLLNRTFHLQHIFRDLPPVEDTPPEDVTEVFVFGHSHQPCNRQAGRALYFNPGSAGPRRFKLPVTVGRLSLCGDRLESRIIDLMAGKGENR